MDYGIIISLIIFSNCAFITLLFTKTEYRNKLTSQLMDKSIPPDKWWRIAKSVCKLNKCIKVSPPIKHEGRIIIHPSEK
jgi:hypothetical protein